MERLKKLFEEEVGFRPTEEAMDSMIALAEIVEYKRGEVIVETGSMDTNIYFIKDGIVRLSDMNGDKERTYAFATEGTMIMSMYSFLLHKPSYYQIQACTPVQLLKIREEDYWNLVNTNHDVALWMHHVTLGQLAFFEYINMNVKNGSAKERFLALLRKRPDILKNVSQKIVASYLDITPEYLSRLKKMKDILSAKSGQNVKFTVKNDVRFRKK